ncbi:hypothetical protein QX776_12055 [Alteromonadaceae bacterium BrNp21-10]|nr:hypothetical protein [Alteromonadaceae bacterium BrNp21-10]
MTLLDHLLDGIVPLALFPENTKGFYFKGEKNTLTAISQNGMFSINDPVVFRLRLESQKDGTLSLWYEEASLDNLLITNAQQNIPFKTSIQLLKGLHSFEFSYYGWQSFDIKSQAAFEFDASKTRRWYAQYQGMQAQLHPEKLRLLLKLPQGQIELISHFTQNSETLMSNMEGG